MLHLQLMNAMCPQGYEQLILRGRLLLLISRLPSPKISWVEEDKHNGAVNSLELTSQFARQIGDTQLLLTLTRRGITYCAIDGYV